MLLPNSILPLLAACLVAAILVHFVRGYVSPAEDNDDRRRSLRESVFCFLAAVIACFSWHILGPFSDKWQYLLNGGLGLPAAGGSVPVDTAMPLW